MGGTVDASGAGLIDNEVGATQSVLIDTASASFDVAGALTISESAGTCRVDITNATADLTVGGILTVGDAAELDNGIGALVLSGDFIFSGTSAVFTAGAGLIDFTGVTQAWTMTSTSNFNFFDLTIRNGSTVRFTAFLDVARYRLGNQLSGGGRYWWKMGAHWNSKVITWIQLTTNHEPGW